MVQIKYVLSWAAKIVRKYSISFKNNEFQRKKVTYQLIDYASLCKGTKLHKH